MHIPLPMHEYSVVRYYDNDEEAAQALAAYKDPGTMKPVATVSLKMLMDDVRPSFMVPGSLYAASACAASSSLS